MTGLRWRNAAGAAVALSVIAAGCGGSASTGEPFVLDGPQEGSGRALMGFDRQGSLIRYIENAKFAVGLAFRNNSERTLTVVAARARTPDGGLIRQIGAVAQQWTPDVCHEEACPPPTGFPIYPAGADRVRPTIVRPQTHVAIQLNFQLADCSAVPATSTRPTRIFDLLYRREGEQRVRRQLISLDHAQLRLRNPSRRDCADRPASFVSVQGPFAADQRRSYSTSSQWTLPGSDGDICTGTRGGRLHFRSRIYSAPRSFPEQVTIDLPRLRGRGLYRSVSARSLGPAKVTLRIRQHGRWKQRRATLSIVEVEQTGKQYGGRFRGELDADRFQHFRTFGRWRCVAR